MSVSPSAFLIVLSLVCTAAFGQANPKCQVQPKTLAAMRHCYRPLLVFSPTANDPRLKRQSRLLDEAADDMMDRFVMFTPVLPDAKGFSAPLDTPYVVLGAHEMQSIRTRFKFPSNTFVVLLLGEDGGESLRSTRPVDPTRLNSLIDTMPSRKMEMQRPHSN
jgi:hypothetical protein